MTQLKSWWIKFDRALEHLLKAEAMVAAATVDQPVRIEKSPNAEGIWEYTVHHDASIDPAFPAVVGDFLFDLRSALDHIAAANRVKPTWKTPYPLFHDPIGGPAAPGEPSKYKRYRDSWDNVRDNTPPAIFDLMDKAQPFNAPRGLDPADTALAVLNELHNRDKHASLAVVTSGIKDMSCWIELPDGRRSIPDPILPPGMFPNGATVFNHDQDLEIGCRGRIALAIAAGPTGGYRPLPQIFRDMASEVGSLLRSIEGLMQAPGDSPELERP